ncbi:thyroxine-binding globulin [Plakobranchus ocellatus]|uniref:Thyroxine-binding globulin n=1 Tax=Plakobranchus ocellatus TaxID=259542 RepID=A0AAV4DYY1_9GAST|nr:thyroxine-binding globulin [Plakobranchus ocellatus]
MESFGWDVYRRFAISNPDNFVFSPFSVYAALGMVLLGADGETKRQLISGLHVSSPVHRGFKHYSLSFPRGEDNEGPVVSIANKLYHKQNFSCLRRYLRKVD